LAPSKSRYRAKNPKIGVSKTSDHIQIKIKICISGQEHPGSSKDQNQNLKNMDALYQDREPKLRRWVFQRPVATSK